MKLKKYFKTVIFVFLCVLSCSIFFDYAYASPNGGYKLVNFKTKGSSLINTHYVEEVTGREGYTNGYYGADAIYLGTDGDNVKFKLAGVVGYVNKNDVELVNMETQADYDKYYTSFYKVDNGAIYHKIAQSITSISYGTTIVGKNTIGLQVGKDYLSYDGHYFYEASLKGYKEMTDDYVSGTYTHAVNAGRPYYNYYQYLSHRSKTNYTAKDIENYIANQGFTSKVADIDNVQSYESQLFGEQDSFINNQNIYGANALMMFGLAMNESNRGKSRISIRTNNLFGHGAYDSAPGANANGYDTVANGILAHAKHFVSMDYMDPKDYLGRYRGGHFGNKASGFNVKYASDPYWGEKAATYYYNFEVPNGFQDFGEYTLGIKTNYNVYNIYKEPNTASNVIYNTGNNNDYPVIILGEVTGTSINGNDKWYRIQADPVLNNDRTAFIQDVGEYNYDNNYAYIHSSAINVVVRNGIASISTSYDITFNANGGKFADNSQSKTLTVPSGVVPTVENPTKEGYNFIGWNESVVPATGNKTYTAKWEAKVYNVTFDANGGSFSDGKTSRVVNTKYQVKPTIDEPTRAGYLFKGWSPTVEVATKNATYKAVWEKTVSYNVTFNADGGVFSNNKEELVLSVTSGTIPKVEQPVKDGYVFVNWTPELTAVTKETSYKAVWKKGTVEDYLTKKSGNFYLEYLKNNNNSLVIKGYQTINGINNTLEQNIRYDLVFESKNNKKNFRQPLIRITNQNSLGRPAIGTGNYNYTYSWFEGTIDLSVLDNDDYKIYVVAYSDKFYSKNVVNNLLYKSQITNFNTKDKYALIRTDVTDEQMGIEFMIRSEILGVKETSFMYSQYDQFRKINFIGDKLNILGYSYSYGTNYSSLARVTRQMIFENTETYKKYTYNIGSITNGLFKLTLPSPDGYDKTRGWYNATLDLSQLEPGVYVIYLSNKTNLSDFGELKDILYTDLSKITTTIKGKKYSLVRNDKVKHRLELHVK